MNNSQQNDLEEKTSKTVADGAFSVGKGMMLSATITGYILGPLLLLGGIGFFLDKFFGTKPWIMLGALLIAFFLSNLLIFKRSEKIAQRFTGKSE